MLRVGLTGGLGSGKSTVAALLREHGAHVIEADEVGRQMMEPGQPVFEEIVRRFGPEVVRADGSLDRPRLAQMAFTEGRVLELNAIVHPAVIAAQQRWSDEIFARDPQAVAVVESALIFEVERDAKERGEEAGVLADWRNRFDRVIVLTAPDDVKVARYVARLNPDASAREPAVADARRRLAKQMPDGEKAERADYVIENTGDLDSLREKVAGIWEELHAESRGRAATDSLK